MRRTFVRALLFLTTTLVVWMVAPRAFAASTRAPVCDPRGAITFAPPPQIQDPEQSLDAVAAEDDCAGASSGDAHHVERGRRAPGGALDGSQEPTAGARILPVARGGGVRVPAPVARAERLRPGHRTPPDRPPRA